MAVLGKPVAHSLSPALHRAAYEHLGMTDWSYNACECDAADLSELLAGLGPTWRGLSLTMPLKEEALLLANTSSMLVRQTGAVNTLVREPGGWVGENTDVVGIRNALLDAGVADRGPIDKAVLVGSGATARSALAAVTELGVRQVLFVVRDCARAFTLAQARDYGLLTEVMGVTEGAKWCLETPLLINTTPATAADGLADAIAYVAADAGGLSPLRVLLDVVYTKWPTRLASVLASSGATVVPGVAMLIHQAAAQFELMTGQSAPLRVMQAVGRAAVGS